MTWKEHLASSIGLVYLALFVGYLVDGLPHGKVGMAVMFVGYAIAQVGIVLQALGR